MARQALIGESRSRDMARTGARSVDAAIGQAWLTLGDVKGVCAIPPTQDRPTERMSSPAEQQGIAVGLVQGWPATGSTANGLSSLGNWTRRSGSMPVVGDDPYKQSID
jgi:hypothetical protein